MLAAPASAQNTPADAQYGDTAEQVGAGKVSDPGDPSASDPGVGSLPFTGLDLGLMAAAAAGLVAGGVALHRRNAATGESRG